MGIKTGAPITMFDVRGEVNTSSGSVSMNDSIVRDLAYRRTSNEQLSFSQFAGNFKKGIVFQPITTGNYESTVAAFNAVSQPYFSATSAAYYDHTRANGAVLHLRTCVYPMGTWEANNNIRGARSGIITMYPNGSIIETKRLRLGSAENTNSSIAQNSYSITLNYALPTSQSFTLTSFKTNNVALNAFTPRRSKAYGGQIITSATDRINTFGLLYNSNSSCNQIIDSAVGFFPTSVVLIHSSFASNNGTAYSRLIQHNSRRAAWFVYDNMNDHNKFGMHAVNMSLGFSDSTVEYLNHSTYIINGSGGLANVFNVANQATSFGLQYNAKEMYVTNANNIVTEYFPPNPGYATGTGSVFYATFNSVGVLTRARLFRTPLDASYSYFGSSDFIVNQQTENRYIITNGELNSPSLANGTFQDFKDIRIFKYDSADNLTWGRRYILTNGRSWFFTAEGKSSGIRHSYIERDQNTTLIDPTDTLMWVNGSMFLSSNAGHQLAAPLDVISTTEIKFTMCLNNSNGSIRWLAYNLGGLYADTNVLAGPSITTDPNTFINTPASYGVGFQFNGQTHTPLGFFLDNYNPNRITTLAWQDSGVTDRYKEASQVLFPPQTIGVISGLGDYNVTIRSFARDNPDLRSNRRTKGVTDIFWTNYRTGFTSNIAVASSNAEITGTGMLFSDPAPGPHMEIQYQGNNYTGNIVWVSYGMVPANQISTPIHMLPFATTGNGTFHHVGAVSSLGYTLNTSIITVQTNTTVNVYSIIPNNAAEPYKFFPRAVANVSVVTTDASWVVQNSTYNANTAKTYDVYY